MNGYHQSTKQVESVGCSQSKTIRCKDWMDGAKFQATITAFVLSSQHAMASNKVGHKEEEEAAGALPLDVEALTISSKEPMCASCGKPEVDGRKLKTCTACKSVKYCNVDCQRNHRKAHKKECKRIEEQLRGAGGLGDPSGQYSNLNVKEASDDSNDEDDIFKTPPREECPLCLTPLPIRDDEIAYQSCCGKKICDGCNWKHDQVLDKTNAERALEDPPKPPLEHSCAFCRKLSPTSDEELIDMLESRMALGDSEAFDVMGGFYAHGNHGLARDDRRAFELRHRAAELGSADGCFNVSVLYREGICVARDTSKEEHYLRLAAKKNHILARNNLGNAEWEGGNYEVAVKHWMISAMAGHDNSTKSIGMAYRNKCATKDQYEMAIRLNKDAKEEMSSEERDKAKAARASGEWS